MDKSSTINYNENVTPSAPTLNKVGAEDIERDPRFIDDGFQNNFNPKSNVGPPPQQSSNSFLSFMSHQPDSDDSYFGRLYRNRRQTRSVVAGKSVNGFSYSTINRDKSVAYLVYLTFFFFCSVRVIKLIEYFLSD